MTSDEQFERIKQLIAEQQCYPIECITLQTRLQSDTGMAGDDGNEFLVRFQDELSVDLSTLRYYEHFGPEGVPFTAGLQLAAVFAVIFISSSAVPWLIPVWAAALYFYFRHTSRIEHPGEIRVSDLLRSAEAHRWTFGYKSPNDTPQ